ncbi:hypothetical protein [Lactiplantibacillus mudanjiangensis]|uniref:Uncharacterized protein n=1 Tax=Lactiplantibacillus mudanjiangensis TaxID=1296538 RepID=A0A660DXM8_9LACO|nr:hypothetical protein [Lactiplantibacillus mudanjiangensis]VDG25736.1 hypothetical protein [Lactobacillus sp. CBA3605] [Lactiplantibacillus mudanjiangensis]VDG27911.1 hypothetical protein [Lactobacillus sp. CBA3605] [Lactiplantibacillus mudanjiangensis]
MLGELSFLLGIIIAIIFIFSKKTIWSWALIILGLLVVVTSFNALPTLIAGICFILMGCYGIKNSKITLLKNTRILRGALFLVTIVIVGGTAGVVNHLATQKANRKEDIKAEKVISKELNNLKPETATSKYQTIKYQIYTINDFKIRKRLMSTYNSKKEDHTDYLFTNNKDSASSSTTADNSQIKGNANGIISAISKDKPDTKKYIKSINTNSEYGLKVVTRGLKIKSQSDTQKTVGNLEAIMRVIHKADSTKGIGFIQKEASGDTMFVIYFKSNVITDNTAVGTEDFFDGATSFYVDGSVAGSNPVFSSRSLSKEGPVINSKTYVNMLMYD